MELAIVCDSNALDTAQRARYPQVREALGVLVREVVELPDGYGLRLSADSALLTAAEFIALERLCCPFLRFVLEVEPAGGPAWLRLVGGQGVKEFLQTELGLRQ